MDEEFGPSNEEATDQVELASSETYTTLALQEVAEALRKDAPRHEGTGDKCWMRAGVYANLAVLAHLKETQG